MNNLTIDLISFLTIVAAVSVFFAGLGYWFGRITAPPKNGMVIKLRDEIASCQTATTALREDIGKWRVEDRHAMRNEMHVYLSPTLDKVDEDRSAVTHLRERVVTLEADNRRRKS